MTVNIISWVPAYAGGESVTLIAPNISGSDIGTNFAGPDNILIGTGVGTFESVTMSDVLDGTFSTSGGPVGYSYNDLALPTASMDANNQLIINLLNPVNLQDAATKAYVDLQVAGPGTFLPLAGGTMDDHGDISMGDGGNILLDFGSVFIPSLNFNGDPTTGMYRSAVNEISFTNDAVGSNPTFTIEVDGTLNVAGTLDYELQVTSDDDIPNKKYVDAAIVSIGAGSFLELIGGTMTGDITFAGTQLFPFDETIENILAATNVQAAIDELSVSVDGITGATYVNSFNTRTGVVVAAASDYDAIQVDYDNTTSLMAAVNVQEAIDELDDTIDDITTATYVNSFNTRLGDVVPATSDYDAIQVDFTPAGTLTSTDVQAALVELDTTVNGIITAGPYLPLAGDTMTGNMTFNGTQLFPYDNSGTSIIGSDMQTAITELDGRVDAIETVIATGPFLELAGGTMTGQLNFGSLTAISLADPVNPQDAATMNYVDTEIGNLGLVGTGPFLELAGGTMTGLITGLSTLTVGDHILGASDYQSGLGGNSFLITTSDIVTSSTPTYSFISATDTGMYTTGAELRFSVGGSDRISLLAGLNGDVSVNDSKVTNVANPVDDQDAVNKRWIDGMTMIRGFTPVIDFDLTAAALTTGTFFTIPVGKKHIYTQIILRLSSNVPGGAPSNPFISVGVGAGIDNILPSTELDFGAGAGADLSIIIPIGVIPAITPGSGAVVQIRIQTSSNNTDMKVDAYLVGMEL